MSKLLTALALAALMPSALAATDGPERAFTGRDLFALAGATDPQISPDGSRIAYVRTTGDIMADRMRPSLWLIDAKTGSQHPLAGTADAAFSPRWSPDGTRLAYVSSAAGRSPQLHVHWLASGEDAALTDLPDSPSSLEWAPDGRSIAYVMRVPDDGPKLGKAPDKPEGAKWAEPLEIIDRVTYRNDDAGSEDYRTPVSEAEQYYAALQIRGVPTMLVKVPGASHEGLAARPSQAAAKAAAILAWFDRYRQPGRSEPSAPAAP